MKRPLTLFIGWALGCVPLAAGAVALDPEGFGQALLFPYYTVQSNGADAFNTQVSIVNVSSDAKVVKVRFREGRDSRLVAEFNLYLAGGDSWAGAVVPDGDGAKLITVDGSCTDPPFTNGSLPFTNANYSGAADDGAGTGLDRAREGHFEAIEMGVLTAGSSSSNAINASPRNCAAVQNNQLNVSQVTNPTGLLRGTAALINVNRGLDVTYDAEALANLTTAPFYSAPGQPGTDFDSPQVTPLSNFTAAGFDYRLIWSRGIDAVSSVLMATFLQNDFVLDTGTNSHTDWVLTAPTRRFYETTTGAAAPFDSPFRADSTCEFVVGVETINREGVVEGGVDFSAIPPGAPQYRACWSASVMPVRNAAGPAISDVFASRNATNAQPPFNMPPNLLLVLPAAGFPNGYLSLGFGNSLISRTGSTMTNHVTGAVITSAFILGGHPVTGFMARTFENGSLACGSSVCQGNYSAAFAHHRIRGVTQYLGIPP